jgi:hypothetical protein
MKYYIDEDELYPFYEIGEDKDGVEIPPEKVCWIDDVMKEFRLVQKYMREIKKQSDAPKRGNKHTT